MSSFLLLKEHELTSEARSVLAGADKAFPIIPMFYRLLAAAPTLLQAYWHSYQHVLEIGSLPLQLKELIFLAVARKSRCHYCTSVHLAVCDIFEVDRSTLDAVITEASDIEPPRVAGLIKFCLEAMDDPDTISQQQYQHLYDHGINQQEILEALYTVAYSNSGIFLAKVLKVEIEPEINSYLHDHQLSIGFS
ncbi:MAG: hypothetical protein COA99_02845 [Moraxellaceae bacterium]|nr:MAG: hypothetical protein COA99_02845 [Moraxellaceae bacterium]